MRVSRTPSLGLATINHVYTINYLIYLSRVLFSRVNGPRLPTLPASAILSTLGSATSTKSLPKVVKFVRALVSCESNLEKVKEGDYTFEATLKMCEINNNNRALRDFFHMIGYIRLAFHDR
jgi:hypothetical protein